MKKYVENERGIGMGIMDRMKDIISANVNALFDTTEDPVRMIDQYVRNLQEDLLKIRAKELVLQADEKNALRKLEECKQEIARLERYSAKAEENGKAEDKAVFDLEIEKANEKLTVLETRYQEACANAREIHDMYEKLKIQVKELSDKSIEMKAKLRAASTQSSSGSPAKASADYTIQKTASDIDKLEKLEDEINCRLQLANDQLESANNQVEILKKQYDEEDKASLLEKELEDLKDE